MVAAIITVVALVNAPNIKDITCQSFWLVRDASANFSKMPESSSISGEGECDGPGEPVGFCGQLITFSQHSNIPCHRHRLYSFPSAALHRQKGFQLGILQLIAGEVSTQKLFLVGSRS